MGTWGPTAFENDEALDWLGSMASLKRVRIAFRRVLNAPAHQEIDADQCACALAAAECIAAARGHRVGSYPDAGQRGLATVRSTMRTADHAAALAVVARVVAKSELATLWVGQKPWQVACDDLRKRLRRKPAPLPRFVRPKRHRPKIGDVALVPLKDRSLGVIKVVSLTPDPPKPVQFGVYGVRLRKDQACPAELGPFLEILHGLTRFGPDFWPVVRNEPVLASEIMPIANGGTSQPNRARPRMVAHDMSTMARGLRVKEHADGTATVSFTAAVARELTRTFPFPGWLANRVAEILAHAER